MVTVTTIGYGEFVPTSVVGRVFGGALILVGLGLFSLLTASLTATFVSRDEAADRHETAALAKMLVIEKQIAQLDNKIDQFIQQNKQN